MSRFHRTIALSLLLAFLTLPAFAVPSGHAYRNSAGSFLATLWSYIAPLFSADTTDGRCGADPWGICTGGDFTNQRGTVDPAG